MLLLFVIEKPFVYEDVIDIYAQMDGSFILVRNFYLAARRFFSLKHDFFTA